MGVGEIVTEGVIIVVCAGAGAMTLLRPDWIWRLGVRLSLCKGEKPDPTYKSVIWIVGVVLVAIAAVHLVTTVMQLAM
ncbi:hypothetical protein [uncultured Bifidobacterium sp.]|uniref:hypothetical protein n=1 Tax=uncultured Bifidobacterium sp. TaxID=165187 RepID=UPI0025912FD7|nr:hypothetical protein [uncultured Bifidobacterium sp.]